MQSRKKWTSLALALAICLTCAVTAGANVINEPEEVRIADVEIRDGIVIWYSEISEDLALKVALADGRDYYQEFKAGETPYFKINGDEGGIRPDGNYTWTLIAMPKANETSPGSLPNGRKWELDPSELPKSYRQTGNFTVCEGYFVDPHKEEESGSHGAVDPTKDQVILDDLIVDGSACIGFDCVNGESFGFDTIRLKENNLRIKFEDTSGGAFPSNDWQLTANDSANGGANKFSIDDISNSRTPFTVEARAPSHSLYVDDGGRLGLGTSIPVVDIHAVSGNSPTLRLEQNGSSGFAPQTWDVAGNETNFFIRDASNGSQLPFRIRPSAPTNSIYIDTDGDVGFGTTGPDGAIEVARSNGTAKIRVEENDGTANQTRTLLELVTTAGGGTNVRPRFAMSHDGAGATWNFDVLNNGNFAFTRGGGGSSFVFTAGGDVQIDGDFIAGGTTLNVPDFVFADDYDLMPLEEVKAFIEEESHLPEVPSAKEVNEGGLNVTQMQLMLLQKVEELTLYTLDQHETIQTHQDTIRSQQDVIQELMSRLDKLEAGQN